MILDYNNPLSESKTVMPLSLLALRHVVKRLSLNRSPEEDSTKHVFVRSHSLNIEEKHKESLTGLKNVTAALKIKVKRKKLHEISSLAEYCVETARAAHCFHLVDCGSGVGHLCRMLLGNTGLKVCNIEANSVLSDTSKDAHMRLLNGYVLDQVSEIPSLPLYMKAKITYDMDVQKFIEDLKAAFKCDNDDFKFGIVGLHACGDFGSNLLRLFAENNCIRFINLVSCCYMKLSTKIPVNIPTKYPYFGYPMSKFMQSKNYVLGYFATDVSCHANEKLVESLKKGDDLFFKAMQYRVVLEKIIDRYCADKASEIRLRNVNLRTVVDFKDYCVKTLMGTGLCKDIPDSIFNSPEVNEDLDRWFSMVAFDAVRHLVAPLVETVILLDRFLFLTEKGVHPKLIPIFDPLISPRNYMLVAVKPDKDVNNDNDSFRGTS